MIHKIILVILSADQGLFGEAGPFKMAAHIKNGPRLCFKCNLLATEQWNYNIYNEALCHQHMLGFKQFQNPAPSFLGG